MTDADRLPSTGALPEGVRPLVWALVALGGFRLLFPGDTPFINDEPRLIALALEANEAGRLASRGLTGTRGAQYGPLPIWLYQLGLSVTSDLRVVASLRAVLVTALSGWALVLLARGVRGVVPVLGAFAFLSPYLWLYSRDLWDNSFGVPFSAMCLAAYARYVRTGEIAWLGGSVAFGTACLLTHLMTLPVLVAVAVHFVATRWKDLVRSRRLAGAVLAIATAALAVSAPYLSRLRGSGASRFALAPDAEALGFALAGFRVFSVAGFDYVIGPWSAGGLAPLIVGVSLLAVPAGAYGFFLLLRTAQGPESTPDREIARVLLYALFLFVLLANSQRLTEHPHYYSGVWAVFFCCWWVGTSRLMERAWARRLFYAQAAVVAGFLVGLVVWLHVNGGTRSLRYGPTLANQMAVASELNRRGAQDRPPSFAMHPELFPHAIGVLRWLDGPRGGEISSRAAPGATPRIEYAEPTGSSGTLVVR